MVLGKVGTGEEVHDIGEDTRDDAEFVSTLATQVIIRIHVAMSFSGNRARC
jgi:hypothetical protein